MISRWSEMKSHSSHFARAVVLIVLSMICGHLFVKPLAAQEPEPRRPSRPVVFYELLNLIAEDTSKTRLDVNARILHTFFVFVRSEKDPRDFIARGEISVEVLDSLEHSVARQIRRRELHRAELKSEEPTPEGFINENFSFTLSPGSYKVVFEVTDLESKRTMSDKKLKELKNFFPVSRAITDPLFVERVESVGDSTARVFPVNLGGDTEFGKDFEVLLQTADEHATGAIIHYTLYKLDEGKKRTPVMSDSTGPSPGLENRRLVPLTGDALVYELRPDSQLRGVTTYLIHIKADTLQWGAYSFSFNEKGKPPGGRPFEIRWLDMPLTLADPLLSSQALEYLMPRADFADFMKKSDEEMRKQFTEFWKKRDPTPSTAFNEAMAEYYRRCDYALEHFATLSRPNGIKSDRGKIYILYGPPTRKERQFVPNSPPREIWSYENLAMRFTFIDESRSGNYTLLSSEKI
jgi:GWxTD domain-containing protein